MIEKENILGVGITNASRKEVLEYVVKSLENFKKKYFVVTPNPEFLVLAQKNSEFKDILNKADLASADGVGVLIAGKILGKPLRERLTGVELLEMLCKAVAEKPITVGFLGGGPKVAEKTAECLRKKYPGLKVAFAGSEWQNGSAAGPVGLHPRPTSSEDALPAGARRGNTPVQQANSFVRSHAPATRLDASPESGLSRISQSKSIIHHSSLIIHHSVDILFVAFGAPKQEFWISENLDKIPVKVAIGVGGAFDYISGKALRAPLFIQKLGLEWLFRLIIQPWRIRRQLALVEFIWLVLKEKLNKN